MDKKTPSPDPKASVASPPAVDPAAAGAPLPAQPTSAAAAGEANPSSKPESATLRVDANAGDSSSSSSPPESEAAFQGLLQNGDFDSLAEMLECEELEAANGVPGLVVYERLLAIYLLQNDFHNAKLLWKRIPTALKTGDSELCGIWAVGQKVATSDFAGIYEALRRPWTTNAQLMNRMLETTRRRAVDLVAKAYESIAVENLTTLLGTAGDEESTKMARELQWVVDDKMVFPKTKTSRVAGRNKFAAGDAHLGLLTDYVSFLESH